MSEADTEGEDGAAGTGRDASAARLAVWVTVVRYRLGQRGLFLVRESGEYYFSERDGNESCE